MGKILKNTKKAEQNRNRTRLCRGVAYIMRKDEASLSIPRNANEQVAQFQHRTSERVNSCENDQEKLSNSLRMWANTYTITMRALTALLKILKSFGMTFLPNDCRALLKTPRTVEISTLAGGKYWHDGLQHSLSLAFANMKSNMTIEINISSDGLPLFKGSPKSFWPLLFNIKGELIMIIRIGFFIYFISLWQFSKDLPMSNQWLLAYGAEKANRAI